MDFSPFHKHMAQHYKTQRDALEAQNAVLWEIAFSVLEAIAKAPLDGSGQRDLEKVGDAASKRLQELLCPAADEHAVLNAARAKGFIE